MIRGVFPESNLPSDSQKWRRRTEHESRAVSQALDAARLADSMENRSLAGQLGAMGRTTGALAEHATEIENAATALARNTGELELQVTKSSTVSDIALPVVSLPGAGTVVTRTGSVTLQLPVTSLVPGRRRIVTVFMSADKTQTPARSTSTKIVASLAGGTGEIAYVPPSASQPADTPQTISTFADIPSSQATIVLNWRYESSYFRQPVPAGEPASIDERGWLRGIQITTSVGSP